MKNIITELVSKVPAFSMSNTQVMPQTVTLSALGTPVKPGTNYIQDIVPKTVLRTRQDILQWNNAFNNASNVDDPKRYPLYNLYNNILIDLHLQSQINNRALKSLSQPFLFKDSKGNIDVELTDALQNESWVNEINTAIVNTRFYGHSLLQLDYVIGKEKDLVKNKLSVYLFPRQNVIPTKGYIYNDYTEDKFIKYREQKEYGTWLLEFGYNNDFGILNGCVPHVLFKRFAQSCYSELCEIYGIPPRILKTNTRDKTLTERGKKMMQEFGSAAWMIIDSTEEFAFASGANTNGDVYRNLINLCNNEMSMGICGVVVGQDTKNGSNSKEKTSVTILQDLVDSDMSLIEQCWNSTIIPALQAIGLINADVKYSYPPSEDIDKLWKMTSEASAFMDIDPTWVKSRFGIEVLGAKKQPTTSLSLPEHFFV